MRVLVTGSEGYIGAVLRDPLLGRGHEVVGLDTGFFRECDLGAPPTPIPLVRRDLREVWREDVEGFDAVIHLAALSNDPLGALDESLTEEINTRASVRLAELAKACGVPRFLFASSCSLYGEGAHAGLREDAPFHPQTAYARSKVAVETALRTLADDTFSPTYLRNATAFGLSPRLRFDVVLNNLVGWAVTTHTITLISDGSPWRPLVHVLDISKAFVCALEAPREAIHNEAFNVGSDANNYQIRTLAEKVQAQFPGCALRVGTSDGDARSYHVDFEKLHARLPRFDGVEHSVDAAIAEMKACFERLALQEEAFLGRLYTRLKQIEHLRRTRQVDDRLYWTR